MDDFSMAWMPSSCVVERSWAIETMQELHRFQKLSVQALAAADSAAPTEPTLTVGVEATLPLQPPVAPPTSLYANLPSEWPLARISVWMRHISVLLRVTRG